jgi:hypothetical protein
MNYPFSEGSQHLADSMNLILLLMACVLAAALPLEESWEAAAQLLAADQASCWMSPRSNCPQIFCMQRYHARQTNLRRGLIQRVTVARVDRVGRLNIFTQAGTQI